MKGENINLLEAVKHFSSVIDERHIATFINLLTAQGDDLYFIDEVEYATSQVLLGHEYDNHGQAIDFNPPEDSLIKTISNKSEKIITKIDSISDSGYELPSLLIRKFQCDGEIFQIVNFDETHNFRGLIKVPLANVYLKRTAYDTVEGNLNFKKSPAITPERKVLALLARALADNELATNSSSTYRSGNKVNSSAVREKIEKLAKKHDINLRGIKSIEDTISKTLTELDLKELN